MKRATATALALICAASATAQAPERSAPIRSAVEAVAAEVEVLVLDAKGIPVEGLTKGEFRLFVNGKETPLDFFEAPPALASQPEPARASKPAPAPDSQVPASQVPAARRPHSTVFVISDLQSDLRSRNTALEGLQSYVDRLPAGEEAALYVLDDGVRRLQGFTADRSALKKALARTAKTLPRSYVFTETRGQEWVGQSRQMLLNFSAVLDGLASRPEPKTVVVVTGPLSPTGLIEPIGGDAASVARAAQTGTTYESTFSYRAIWNFLGEAKKAEGLALLARATIVALDPTGLNAPDAAAEINSLQTDLKASTHPFATDGSTTGRGNTGAAAYQGSSLRPPSTASESDKIDTWEFRSDTFALIAMSTGGARLGFSNKPVGLLDDETRRLERRYRLGFTPPDGTSRRREIRVEVSRPGVTVRTATGQRSQTPETAALARFAGLLLSADAPKGDFVLGVEMKAPVKKRTDDALPFDILVPVSGVYAEERPEGKRAKLELMIAGVDEEGRASAPEVIPFSVTLDKSAGDGSFFRKDSNFRIDARWKGRLFIGVRDTATNRLGAVAIAIGG